MDKAASTYWVMAEQDQRLTEAIGREQGRLRNFIRRRVADEADAEDILQDVFYELIEGYRLMKPIEQVGAWLFRVARNRIIDAFRKKKPEPLSAEKDPDAENGDSLSLEEMLPSPDAGPEAPTREAFCWKSSTPRSTNSRRSSAKCSSLMNSRGSASRKFPRKRE